MPWLKCEAERRQGAVACPRDDGAGGEQGRAGERREGRLGREQREKKRKGEPHTAHTLATRPCFKFIERSAVAAAVGTQMYGAQGRGSERERTLCLRKGSARLGSTERASPCARVPSSYTFQRKRAAQSRAAPTQRVRVRPRYNPPSPRHLQGAACRVSEAESVPCQLTRTSVPRC